MLGVLVILLAVFWVVTKDIRLERKKKRIMQAQHLDNATLIKYDGRTVKVLGIMTVMSIVLFVVSFLLEDLAKDLIGILVMVAGGMFVIFLPTWLVGRSYLNRMKKLGYEIPWCSKDYDYILEKVPRRKVTEEQEPYSRRSKIFACLYGYVWLCMMAVNLWLCCKWRVNSCVARFALLAVPDVYWLICAWQFYRQMNNDKYKEDTEVDKSRKNRKNRISLERAVVELLIMLLIAVGFKSLASNFGDAAYRAQIDADRGWMQEIHGMMDLAYRELVLPEEETTALFTPEERAGDWSGTRQQLMEGVDITTWGIAFESVKSEKESGCASCDRVWDTFTEEGELDKKNYPWKGV